MAVADLRGKPSNLPATTPKAQELALHRVDPGDIGRDEVIAAAFVGQHLKLAAGESRGGASAAKMDEGRNILLLLRACGHSARARTEATLRSDTRMPVRWHGSGSRECRDRTRNRYP